jgi:hypothetical protein
MKEHVERMKKELDELGDKINKLGVFIYENEKFDTLSPFEQVAMIKQLGFMQAYRDVLLERFEHAK